MNESILKQSKLMIIYFISYHLAKTATYHQSLHRPILLLKLIKKYYLQNIK